MLFQIRHDALILLCYTIKGKWEKILNLVEARRTIATFEDLILVLEGVSTVKEEAIRFGVIVESECLVVVWIIKLLWYFGRLLKSRMFALKIM